MTQVSMRDFISKAFDVSIKRTRLALLLCVPILLLAVVPAWGGTFSPGRMVYANGQIHRIWISNQYMYHQAGLPADPVNGTGDFIGVKDANGVTIPADRGPYICRYHTLASNEGLAVFNNLIIVGYTKDTTCGNSGDMSAYIAVFDMTGTTQYPHGRWALKDYPLGPVAYESASAVAITVFDGELYAFTVSDTYTSGDGFHWTDHFKAIVPGHDPLDAVTIYSQNTPPQILLVYAGASCNGCNYFTHIGAATWNGDFNSSRRDYVGNCAGAPAGCLAGNPIVGYGTSHPNFDGRVSLLPGTRKGSSVSGSVSGDGDKVLAVQLFVQSFSTSTNRWGRNLEYHVEDGNWYTKDITYNPCTGLMVYPWYVSACDTNHKAYQARKQRLVALGCGQILPFDSDYMVPLNSPDPNNCDVAAGTKNFTDIYDETTRKYATLIGVVTGTPPFSLNEVTVPAEIKDASNVVYGTTNAGTTEHTQKWTHQNMISTGVEVHAGFDLFNKLLNISVKDSFDSTYKHDWESTHKDTEETEIVSTDKIGTDAYAEGVFQPVPYSPTCTTDVQCTQYADPYVNDNDPACRIYDRTVVPNKWRLCQQGDTACLCTESPTGKTGSALFNAPTLYVQDYMVYAYDYNPSLGRTSGTYLNQDLHTIEAKGFSMVPVTFDLQHPELVGRIKNPDGSYKPNSGLLQGMKPFPYSTDFSGWSAQNWDRLDQPWVIKLGPITSPNIPLITHETDQNLGQEFTHTTEDVDASEETTSNEIRNNTSVEAGTGLLGFGVNLTVGKDSSFSTSVSTKVSFGENVRADLGMKNCTAGDLACVSSLWVQPYLLQAMGKAPWVPDLYPTPDGAKGPWCMTWTVTRRCPGGPGNCDSNSPPTGASAATLPLLPLNASGRIVSGNGGGAQGGPYSHYFVEGARLAWADANGGEVRIPMTADEFVPSQGVTIEVNGKSSSSSGNGSWTRSGNIWTFQTDPKAQQNRILLQLDFGSATYNLQITKVDLEGHIFAGMTDVVLRLGVNGKYMFSTTLHHDVDITWQWSQPPADNLTTHVTSFQGRYNSVTQSGNMSIAGTLPQDLPAFGDVAMVINGEEKTFPLISMDGFRQAFLTGGTLKYAKEGLILVVDFGNKTWSATFNNKAFGRLLAPRWGKISAKFLVGGLPWHTGEEAVLDYSANLTLVH
jgi:hypothetical protein